MSEKNIAIFGLGKSGVSACRFFEKKNYTIFADDDFPDENKKKKLPKNIILKKYNDWDFKNLDFIIAAPGVPSKGKNKHEIFKLAEKNKCKITSDIEAFINFLPKSCKVIGITGTNGKSTTTALTYHILKENNFNCEIGGNFGIPVFDLEIAENKIYVI